MVSIFVDRPAARSRAAMAVAGASSSARCSSGKTVALYGALMGVKENTVRCGQGNEAAERAVAHCLDDVQGY